MFFQPLRRGLMAAPLSCWPLTRNIFWNSDVLPPPVSWKKRASEMVGAGDTEGRRPSLAACVHRETNPPDGMPLPRRLARDLKGTGFGQSALVTQNLQSIVVGFWGLEAAREPFLVVQNYKMLRLAATDALDGPGQKKLARCVEYQECLQQDLPHSDASWRPAH